MYIYVYNVCICIYIMYVYIYVYIMYVYMYISVVTESAKKRDISGIGNFFSLFSVCALHSVYNGINGP